MPRHSPKLQLQFRLSTRHCRQDVWHTIEKDVAIRVSLMHVKGLEFGEGSNFNKFPHLMAMPQSGSGRLEVSPE